MKYKISIPFDKGTMSATDLMDMADDLEALLRLFKRGPHFDTIMDVKIREDRMEQIVGMIGQMADRYETREG